MAIENIKSDLYRNELSLGAIPDGPRANGHIRCAIGTLTSDAAADANSTYKICELPSDAILHKDTFFDVENWGFVDVRIGTLTDVTALVSATRASATEQQPVAQGDANHAKPLWELLGLTADPAGQIALYAHAVATATGAGSLPFEVYWIDK